MKKRFIVELGVGTDLHGSDVTKATARAIKDAISHSCLCGISEIIQLEDLSKMEVRIKVGCPYPQKLDQEEILKQVPFGKATIDEVVTGGLSTTGLHVDALGEGDQIVISVVSLTVCLDM